MVQYFRFQPQAAYIHAIPESTPNVAHRLYSKAAGDAGHTSLTDSILTRTDICQLYVTVYCASGVYKKSLHLHSIDHLDELPAVRWISGTGFTQFLQSQWYCLSKNPAISSIACIGCLSYIPESYDRVFVWDRLGFGFLADRIRLSESKA